MANNALYNTTLSHAHDRAANHALHTGVTSATGRFAAEERDWIAEKYMEKQAFVLDSASAYFLGILNSNLFTYMFSKTRSEISGGFFRWKRQYMKLISVSPATDAQKAPVVEHVPKILSDPESPDIHSLEKQIDQMVYKLYGHTDDEIKIVEEAAK